MDQDRNVIVVSTTVHVGVARTSANVMEEETDWETVKPRQKYEVESVIGGILSVKSGVYYLAKWKGHSLNYATWEKASVMVQAQQSVKTFCKKYGTPTQQKPKILSSLGKVIEKKRENKKLLPGKTWSGEEDFEAGRFICTEKM